MDLLINLILAVLAYMLATWVLTVVGLSGAVVVLVALLIAVLVFLSNPRSRF